MGALGYARWLCENNGVEFSEEMIDLMDRHSIELWVIEQSSPAPANEPAPLVEEEVVEETVSNDQWYQSELFESLKKRWTK